jgi:peptidoglycan-N-acetylglucosamine deacetylase
MIGGLAGAAALAACTDDGDQGTTRGPSGTVDRDVRPEDAVVNQTYTGVAEIDRDLTLKALIEASDAAAPFDSLNGVHRLVWDVATTQPLVALTVDDGPDPRFTPRVLEALASAGAKATFFMMGHNIHQHPALAKEVVAAGHDVGNHTWSHQDLAFQDGPSARDEVVRCKKILKDVLGSDTTWFRPPRGELSGAAMRVVAAENYDTFLWSVARNDSGVGTAAEVAKRIVARLRPGSIIDMHDSIGRGLFLPQGSKVVQLLLAKREVDVQALPLILEQGQAAGLRFVTITELLAAAANPGALSPAVGPVPSDGPTTVPPTPGPP